MAGHVAQALKQASRGGILLYAPVLDQHLEAMAEFAVPWSSASMTCRELAYSQGRRISEGMAGSEMDRGPRGDYLLMQGTLPAMAENYLIGCSQL
jgi:hypothetical protein